MNYEYLNEWETRKTRFQNSQISFPFKLLFCVDIPFMPEDESNLDKKD